MASSNPKRADLAKSGLDSGKRRCVTHMAPRRAFTLVELLVVMLIMTVLISSVLVASSALITSSKVSNTKAVLAIVDQAIQAFRREQRSRPTLTRLRQASVTYTSRYGHFPPDELEIFTREGLPGSGSAGFSAAPQRAELEPSAGQFPAMRFDGQSPPNGQEANEHRDIAALYLAIELFGTESKKILNRVQERYWKDGPLDPSGNPRVFLDRGPANWDANDIPIRYIVDDWGVPLCYMAQRDFDDANPTPVSSNHDEWNEASAEMIRLNRGRPILFSWGPDGIEQLTPDAMGTDAIVTLVGDFEELDGVSTAKHRIDNTFNADNIYVTEEVKAKLAEGID